MSIRSARPFVISALCLVLALTTYALSPLVTLWSVASALRRDDVPTLRMALDWQGVRDGLKTDLGAGAPVSLASVRQATVRQATVRQASVRQATVRQASAGEDDLPEFGSSFATTLVSHAVDDVMTPEHLASVLSHTGAGPASRPGLSWLERVRRIGFAGPAEFEAAIRMSPDDGAPPVVVTMHVEKWQWKVTRIHLPEQLLDGGGGNDRT